MTVYARGASACTRAVLKTSILDVRQHSISCVGAPISAATAATLHLYRVSCIQLISLENSPVIVWSYKKKKKASKEELDQQKAAQLTVNRGLLFAL